MRKVKFFPFLVFLIGLSTVSLAQTSNTATADASLTIITPISIENTTDLNFGNILSPTTAVTVRVRPNGNRSSNDGATFLPSSLGTISAAKFTVTGEPNATFTVTLPSDDTVVLTKSGGTDMKVQSFRRNQQSTSSLTLGLNGSKGFNVGATLHVNANQEAGLYTGEFQVTVAYN